jgi:hypothetical protein
LNQTGLARMASMMSCQPPINLVDPVLCHGEQMQHHLDVADNAGDDLAIGEVEVTVHFSNAEGWASYPPSALPITLFPSNFVFPGPVRPGKIVDFRQ